MFSLSERTYLRRCVQEVVENFAIGALILLGIVFFLPHSLCTWILLILGLVPTVTALASVVEILRPRKRLPVSGKAVFISGCDSGFGQRTAQEMDSVGFQVFAGCLFPDGEGALHLREVSSDRLHVLPLDVTKDESVNKAVAYVGDHLEGNELWAVVNNAGIVDGGEMHWTEMKVLQRVLDINTMGTIRLTKAFLSSLIKSQGRIINIASTAGRTMFGGIIPYSLSKHAAVKFSEGLRVEMYKFGVQVITVEPTIYRTPLSNVKNIKSSIMELWKRVPEDLRKFYGPGYIEKYLKFIGRFFNSFPASDIMEVVECIVEAALAKQPRYSYRPGTLISHISLLLQRRLPEPIGDMIIMNALRNP